MGKKLTLVLLLLLVILAIRFHSALGNQPQFENNQQLDFETRILSQPKVFGSQQVFTANYENQRIRIVAPRFPEIRYGDKAGISGSLTTRLINDNVLFTMRYPEINIINASGFLDTNFKAIGNLREKLISLFERTLPSPLSSLSIGIIFGIKEKMPYVFEQNLKSTGVFHIIAASGMNVSLVGGFISTFASFFLKRQMALIVSMLGIVFYAFLAGLEPSIIRASIMGIVVFSSQIMGKQTIAAYSLFLAGFLMLIVSPNLIFDIGFQLSFLSTLGILYIKPLLSGRSIFSSEILITFSAQVATFPVILANFGTYSIYSILTNALVAWTIPILMVAGGIASILGLIVEPVGQMVMYLAYPLLLYFEIVVNFFAEIGGALELSSFPWQFSVSYYLFLVSGIVFLRGYLKK
jgi:competence protein ComEC